MKVLENRDTWNLIFNYLGIKDLCRIKCVSKDLNAIANNRLEYLWKQELQKARHAHGQSALKEADFFNDCVLNSPKIAVLGTYVKLINKVKLIEEALINIRDKKQQDPEDFQLIQRLEQLLLRP